MGETVSGFCSLSALALRMLNLWILLPDYAIYVGTDFVEIAEEWNWLRIVFIVGLDTEYVKFCDLLPEYYFYVGTYIVEIADGWNCSGMRSLLALEMRMFKLLFSANRV